MIKKPVKQNPGVFSFLNPLSQEIWVNAKLFLPTIIIIVPFACILGIVFIRFICCCFVSPFFVGGTLSAPSVFSAGCARSKYSFSRSIYMHSTVSHIITTNFYLIYYKFACCAPCLRSPAVTVATAKTFYRRSPDVRYIRLRRRQHRTVHRFKILTSGMANSFER